VSKHSKSIRNGDVILQWLGPAPDTNIEPAEHVLAVGEESGHSHVLRGVMAPADTVLTPPPGAHVGDDARGFIVSEVAELRIEGQPWRHYSHTVQPGLWAFWIQQRLTIHNEVVDVTD
jgi:hypothetical protein